MAVSLVVEVPNAKLAQPGPATGNIHVGPWPRQATGRSKSAGPSNGHAVNGHRHRAGKRSPPRADRSIKTPISRDWSPSETDRVWAKGKGYTDKAIDRMAEKFVANHRRKDTKSKDWSAEWEFWVLREPSLSGGERPVELDAKTGEPNAAVTEQDKRLRLVDDIVRALYNNNGRIPLKDGEDMHTIAEKKIKPFEERRGRAPFSIGELKKFWREEVRGGDEFPYLMRVAGII